ncbi:MAG TPA: SRPBCC domain-containing protein [Vicinamibacterales bacterium]|jgi:uncharacterized protein YndB with AHSA1/START domain
MTQGAALSHRLERTVLIRAGREHVFRFFTDSERWASWWGVGSSIDPTPGGRLLIVFPGGIQVTGDVVEIVSPHRIVFTYGFASGTPIPPGGSLVTIRLAEQEGDTLLHLSHDFADSTVRDEFQQGWRYQLSLFANAVLNDLHATASDAVDGWFAAWSEVDTGTREDKLARLVTANIRFRDRFSSIDGISDLRAHLSALHRFMPGVAIQRDGVVRHCQGTVLADWVARMADGSERGRGTNIFVLNPSHQIEAVTGFWNT